MDFDTLMKLFQLGTDHKFLALAIVVIGWLTSLTSDWSRFPITIPGRYQPLVAALLGVLYGVLVKIDSGTVWYKAILVGFAVGLTTGGLYDVVINAVFGGNVPKWLAWLSFAKKSPPSPPPMSTLGKAESLKPPKDETKPSFEPPPSARMSYRGRLWLRPGQMLIVFAISMFFYACSFFTPARDIAIGKGACIIANAFLDSNALNTICNLLTPEEKRAGEVLSAAHRQKVAEEMKAMRAEVCSPDAGPACSGCADGGAR